MKKHRILQSLGMLLGAFGPALLIGTMLVFFSVQGQARPEFTRETGKRCNFCHDRPPALNNTGRKFKANGFKL
jgi:hypothetical protein